MLHCKESVTKQRAITNLQSMFHLGMVSSRIVHFLMNWQVHTSRVKGICIGKIIIWNSVRSATPNGEQLPR